MTRFSVYSDPWNFESGRDAIDAVSAFESETVEFWEYGIARACADPEEWTVRVARLDGDNISEFAGYLAPTGEQ